MFARTLAMGTLLLTLCANLTYARELFYDFSTGTHGWNAVFTDLPVPDDQLGGRFELDWGIREVPLDEKAPRSGFMLSGINYSDDLGMYIVRALGPSDGIEPGRKYRVTIQTQFASNAATGCFGVGGAPGESVALQLGVTPNAPTRTIDEENHYRLTSREERFASGNIANGIPCPDEPSSTPYVLLTRNNTLQARADSSGRLWLHVGTESGFEGRTQIYFLWVRVEAEPSS